MNDHITKGIFFEKIAQDYLEKQGYTLLEKNWRAHNLGEIDLICQQGDLVVFVEVKGRKHESYGYEDAINSLSFKKIDRLKNSIMRYLQEFENKLAGNQALKFRFDVVIVSGAGLKVTHLENIAIFD